MGRVFFLAGSIAFLFFLFWVSLPCPLVASLTVAPSVVVAVRQTHARPPVAPRVPTPRSQRLGFLSRTSELSGLTILSVRVGDAPTSNIDPSHRCALDASRLNCLHVGIFGHATKLKVVGEFGDQKSEF